ncbi:hypothetical protein [Methylocystis sp.]|uniref:hypothetical protein n=1 Tax=Methylocystis sp. TaxID=1911079 RepID=UPI003DA2E5FE
MVPFLDHTYLAGKAVILEVNVFPDTEGRAYATLDIQHPKTSRRIGLDEFITPLSRQSLNGGARLR